MEGKIKLSLIYPTHGRPQQAADCLRKFFACDVPEQIELDWLIAVRSITELNRVRFLCDELPWIKIFPVVVDDLPGPSQAVHYACMRARGEWISVLNDDIEPKQDWIVKAYEFAQSVFKDRDAWLIALNDTLQGLKGGASFPLMTSVFYHRWMKDAGEYCYTKIDKQWTTIARALGCYAFCKDAVLVHKHVKKDPQYPVAEFNRDVKTYLRNMASFYSKAGIKPDESFSALEKAVGDNS